MGCFAQCDITDGTMRQMAELMVSLGLKVCVHLCTEHSGPTKRGMSPILQDLGYNYVNFDTCWAEDARDATGNMVASTGSFPPSSKYLLG